MEKIILKYREFADSWISNIQFSSNANKIVITITCSNLLNNYKYETIELELIDITFHRIDKNFLKVNSGIKAALIRKDKSVYTVDFDPIDYFDYLKENPESSCIIKCKKIENHYKGEYKI